jgi:hypothetical protein
LARFCGVLYQPNLNTRETPFSPFGRTVLAGLTRRKHGDTRRVEVESKRFSPLAFHALAAHAPQRPQGRPVLSSRRRLPVTLPAPSVARLLVYLSPPHPCGLLDDRSKRFLINRVRSGLDCLLFFVFFVSLCSSDDALLYGAMLVSEGIGAWMKTMQISPHYKKCAH